MSEDTPKYDHKQQGADVWTRKILTGKRVSSGNAKVHIEGFDQEKFDQSIDQEIEALAAAVSYMEQADDRAKERFVHHLVHRYFPDGQFIKKVDLSPGPLVNLSLADEEWLRKNCKKE